MSSNKQQLDLERLRARLREKPRTKVGQIRQAWPCIKELFAAGHSLKDICVWLNEIGISVGYTRLSYYIGELRRSEQTPSGETQRTPAPAPEQVSAADPLARLSERERQRPGFQYNADPDPKKLI
ncbi:MAG: hypothetical protein ABI693_33310 [Bryobacteraceae bacterium]